MSMNFSRILSHIHNEPYKRIDERTSHGKGGKHISQFDHAHFVCWDGEGITDPQRPDLIEYDEQGNVKARNVYQLYALFMNNEGVELSDNRGLSTDSLIHALLYATEDKRAIHCCYGASYDTNMILRDVPEKDLRELHAGKSIDYLNYQFTYRPRKSFEVREYMTIHQKYIYNPKTKKREGWYKRSITLWDVFGFFQLSFIETLDKYFLRGNRLPEEKQRWKEIIEKIKEGKDLRGSFTQEQLDTFVKPYTRLEVYALNELMHQLHSDLNEVDMKVSRWDGAGACAAALLKKYNVKPHIDEKLLPRPVVHASEYAFFGGRIEVLLYGNYEKIIHLRNNVIRKGKVYHKDITSAYPDALSYLPSFQNGEWKHSYTTKISDVKSQPIVSMYLISWIMDFNTIIAPFPWRSRNGNVYFPPRGKAWIYKPELEMALDCFNKGKYKVKLHIHESWSYYPSTDYKPFGFIRDLFEYRKYLISIGSGAEKAIKLAMNSFYGKTAQSIGYNDEKGMKPPYHNLVVAGMVTSMTRAKMMRAAMQCPEFIIMLATDGIYSIKDLKVETSEEKELGKWDAELHDYITIVASGVYWYKTENEDETAYSRGFDKYTIMRDFVLDAWRKNETILRCETTRFVGLGSAIGLNDFKYWCTWRTVYRELGLNMDKVAKRDALDETDPSTHLVRTYARCPQILVEPLDWEGFPYSDIAMSNKYHFRWDDTINMLDGIPQREYLDEAANSKA